MSNAETISALEDILSRPHGRARIARTLWEVLRDALDPSLAARGCPDEVALNALLPLALDAATDAATTALAAAIAPAFENSDAADLERLTFGRRWQEMGWG